MGEALKKRLPLLLALCASALLRAGVTFAALSDMSRFCRPDTAGYLDMARKLCSDGDFGGLTGRVPVFPALCAFFMHIFQDNWMIYLVWFLVAVSVVTDFFIWKSTCILADERAGSIAAWLAALNITAAANAPMLLTDTLFGLVSAVETLLIFKFTRDWKVRYLIVCCVIAAAGALLRPVNLLFPLCALALLIPAKIPWKKRAITAFFCCFAAAFIVTPWMMRNAFCGAGFTIDTNTGAMYHQNGAMLLAEVKKTDFETEKANLISEMQQEFSDRGRYPDERSREAYRIKNYRKLILAHPFVWLKQQLNFSTLIPDAPTFLELFGATSPNRGTMGVLARDGVFAATKHYFGNKYWLIFLILPLLLVSLVTAAGASLYILCAFRKFDRELVVTLLLFALLIWYYLFLPGAISAPRYHIPVLPCACAFAGCFISSITSGGTKSPKPSKSSKSSQGGK